ncbi:MAG: diguanylate cyclase [Lachnospiraceae bacterium]|nr:diguanylate cyclase [Lachnospiraceae bacterium]
MRNRISWKIASLIGVVVIFGQIGLFFLVNENLTRLLQTRAASDMGVIARDRAHLVESYIDGCCQAIDGYSKAAEIREALEHPDDPLAIEKAGEFTNRYAEGLTNAEGLYTAQWDTYVLAHINPDSVNQTFRDEESARDLENRIRSVGTSFCTGIVLAPVTKQMVIPVYAPVYDASGEAIGFAGAAFYMDALQEMFAALGERARSDTKYSLINATDGVYIFDDDLTMVGEKCMLPEIWDAIGFFANEDSSEYSYSRNGKVFACYDLRERNWIFVVSDSGTAFQEMVNRTRIGLFAVCMGTAILVIAVCFATVGFQMRPVAAINQEIVRLQSNDFTHDRSIDQYCRREDELGTISRAVKELHMVLKNQSELFLEMLEFLPVGTLITNAEDSAIVMINRMALELYGFPIEREYDLTIEELRTCFDEESLRQIDEARRKTLASGEEQIFEATIVRENDERIHVLSHTRAVTLSNGNTVVIFSVMDISERKKLENNLLLLSETDALTELCNRRSGESRIRSAVESGKFGMFCLFDVDKFKLVNDNYGHKAGDELLAAIAETMRRTFRGYDILIRLGGDEFALYAVNLPDEKVGADVIARFFTNLEKIRLAGIPEYRVSVSLGALMVTDPMTFAEMYARADSLMYECKKQVGNSFAFFG